MARSQKLHRDKQLIQRVSWLLFIAIVTFAFFPQIKGILLSQSEIQTQIALAKRSVFDHYASSSLDDR
jgi:hypothetical protein